MLARLIDRLHRRGLVPRVSETERQALAAGTVWADGELFSGRPDLAALLAASYPTLDEREQAFLDGPVEEASRRLDRRPAGGPASPSASTTPTTCSAAPRTAARWGSPSPWCPPTLPGWRLAALRRFEAEGRPAEDLPLVRWAAEHGLTRVQRALEGVCRSLEAPLVGALLRGPGLWWLRLHPLAAPPSDATGAAAAGVGAGVISAAEAELLTAAAAARRDALAVDEYGPEEPPGAAPGLQPTTALAADG